MALNDKRINIFVTANTKNATKNLDTLERQTDETKQSASELTSTFKTLFGTAVLGAGARSIIQTASNFESLETSIIQLKGSTEAGQKAFKTFSNIAATTPFKLQNVVEAGVTVQAFGANSEDTLKAITDLAAYMRVDVVDAAGAFGRAFAGGAGAADVLRDRGVLTQVKLKTGFDDLSKMTLPQFRQALIDTLTDPDGAIAGSTDVLAKTFSGKVSNMEDAVDLLQNAIGSRLLGTLGDMAVAVGDAARNAAEFVDSLSGENIEDIKKNVTIMAGMASAYLLYTKGALVARTATLALMRAAKFLIIFEAINLAVINVSENFTFFSLKVKQAQLAFMEFVASSQEFFGKDSSQTRKGIEELTKEIGNLGETAFKLNTESLQKYVDLINGLDEFDLDTSELQKEIDNLTNSFDNLGEASTESGKAVVKSQEKSLESSIANIAAQGKLNKEQTVNTIRNKVQEASASHIANIFKSVPFPLDVILAAGAQATIAGIFNTVVSGGGNSFATGGSFITNKRTTLPIGNGIVVGDNASGMERVDITPLPSPVQANQGNITINISAPLVDETVVDHIIPAIQRAQRLGL